MQAIVSGSYTFSTMSDDGVRLWVNGQLLIDNWTNDPPTANTAAPVSLTGGTKYDVKMEFYEAGVSAAAKLLWSYPGQAQQVIPQGQLYSVNQVPTVNAGADQAITLPTVVNLSGSASDDGLPNPPAALTTTLEKGERTRGRGRRSSRLRQRDALLDDGDLLGVGDLCAAAGGHRRRPYRQRRHHDRRLRCRGRHG